MIFKNGYYCLIAGLPELAWDSRKLPVSVAHFRELAGEALSRRDLRVMNLFFLPNDNRQVLRLLRKEAPETGAATVFPAAVLEEEIAEPTGALPSYLEKFIADYRAGRLAEGVLPENVLSGMYYDFLSRQRNAFVRRYAEFSLNVKNLETALTCRKHGLEIAREVVGGNAFARALRSSNAKDFGLSMDYPYVERVMTWMENPNLVERERGMDLLVWDFIEELVTFEYFSLEKVLGFLLELMIVERWSRMDSESGRRVFMEVVDKFRKSFEFVEEFK